MKLILVLGILGMLRPTFAATIPVEPRDIINDVQCLVVNLLVATLSLIPSATPYCSSFIHIQTSTITLSRTTTTFPTRTQTRTTGTITITAPKFTSTIYKYVICLLYYSATDIGLELLQLRAVLAHRRFAESRSSQRTYPV